ncbi:Tyrosine-protein phosphatase OCA1 [Balamuthia mandrillaris]
MGTNHQHTSPERVPLPTLCPPANFGIVEPNVYRSNALYPINFPFIRQLKLKTVVSLSPDLPNKAVSTFFSDNGITLIHLGLKTLDTKYKKGASTNKPISEELIKEALEVVLDAGSHPIMIMCSSGIHQTGTLVGCFRRLQNWNLTPILQEYRTFSGSSTRFANEQFIELFDVDLVTLPENLPWWFVEQQRMMEEEMAEEEQQQEQERHEGGGKQLAAATEQRF